MRSCWGSRECPRFWAAAALILGVLFYAGISWIPPRSPEAPAVQAVQPVTVPQVLEVTMRTASPFNVNEATADELQELPGIGPVLARRIVEHRRQHGPFGSPEELTDVSGIGPTVLEGFRDRITVD